jgi:hypothetical protein
LKTDLYKLAPDVLLQGVADEMVILNLTDGQYYGLNEVGTRTIQLMSQGENISSIIRCLIEEYEVNPAVLEQDIHDLISELERHALIESVA